MVDCKHQHGDQVPELMGWVCGQCWKILPERPKKYHMVAFRLPADWSPNRHHGSRQELAWQAEIRKSADGTTLSTFLRSVARRISKRSGMGTHDAYQAALEAVRLIETEFGCLDYDWSRMGAIDVADEEMAYWDDAPTGSNG